MVVVLYTLTTIFNWFSQNHRGYHKKYITILGLFVLIWNLFFMQNPNMPMKTWILKIFEKCWSILTCFLDALDICVLGLRLMVSTMIYKYAYNWIQTKQIKVWDFEEFCFVVFFFQICKFNVSDSKWLKLAEIWAADKYGWILDCVKQNMLYVVAV